MTYQLNPDLQQASIENKGEKPVALNHPEINTQILKARLAKEESGVEIFADDIQKIAGKFSEPGFDEDSRKQNENLAGQLLSQLGVNEELVGKINRVRLKKITMEIEIQDE